MASVCMQNFSFIAFKMREEFEVTDGRTMRRFPIHAPKSRKIAGVKMLTSPLALLDEEKYFARSHYSQLLSL